MIRVAVTTAADRAPYQAQVLSDRGLEPVFLPCIEVHPASGADLNEARISSSTADWLLLTSQRAVNVLWPGGGMPAVPVAAVGRATASAIEAAGGQVALIGDSGAAGLVEMLAPRARGQSVVFPHASGANPRTRLYLERAGAIVNSLTVYQTLPLAPGPDEVDVVIVGSPSAIDGWCRSRTFNDILVAAIGETTRDALAGRGRPADVVATDPGFDSLARVIVAHLEVRTVL